MPPLRVDIITVFPEMISAALDHSIVKRARERGLVSINVVNLRDFTTDKHKTTDDMPYGGGGGMVMKIEPIAYALEHLTGATVDEISNFRQKTAVSVSGVLSSGQDAVSVSQQLPEPTFPRIALTDPRGPRFTQETARKWAKEAHLILICGHYEGVDERVRQNLVTDEISIGDYVLTGGELPALVITDALTRLQPDALGDAEAPDKDTFTEDLLEYPHYTRPRVFCGWDVPDILFSGHHAKITRWRRWHQLRDTQERRPDLFARRELSPQDLKLYAGEEPTAPPDVKVAMRLSRKKAQETEAATTGATDTTDTVVKKEETDGTGDGDNS